MIKRNAIFAAVLAAAAFAALPLQGALAEDGKKGHGHMMENMDKAGDGDVSAEEAQAARQERFSKMDADGDGFLTPEELGPSASRHEEMMKRMQEHMQKMQRMRFAGLDADEDGKISAEEFNAGHAGMSGMMSGEMRAMHHRGRGGHGKRHHGKKGDKSGEEG